MTRALLMALVATASLAQEPAVNRGADAGRHDNAGVGSGSPGDLLYPPSYDECLAAGRPVNTRKDLYREGWIDFNKNERKDVYEDAAAPVDARVDDLLRQMTPDEKTAQMATLYGYNRVLKQHLPTRSWFGEVWKDGIANIDEQLNGFHYYEQTNLPGVAYLWPASKHAWALNEVQRFFVEDTRLGVPAEFTDEGIRGVENLRATAFPTQLGMGQTWNRALVRKLGEITGKEASALGYRNVYAPIMDVIRDPRWGRAEEVYGEDPFLVSELGIQMTLGIQGQHIVSTPKHFCIYGNNKGAREGFARVDPRCSPREAEMIHLWPFERLMKTAHPLGVMSSYNDYDGVPVEGSPYYLTELLRGRMGFTGYVVSDSDAVEYLHSKHRVAATYKEAVRQAVMAGLNVRTTFTPPDVFLKPLRELVAEGAIPMEVIDSRVRDVLRVKMWEGLFDHPYVDLRAADETVMRAEHVAVAKEASHASIVLLKNAGGVLPLDAAKLHRIAVVGPNADDGNYARGHYGPLDVPVTTVLQALRAKLGDRIEFIHARGADFLDARWPDTEIMWEPPTDAEQKLIDEAAGLAKDADATVVVVGDTPRGSPATQPTVGENTSRTGIGLTGRQDDLIRAVAAAAAGKPVIVVHISGRPNALNWANRLCPAIVQAFFPGPYGGEAVADVLFGDYNPGGKLTVTVPKSAGQLELNHPHKPAANTESTQKGTVSVTGVLWPFGHGLSYTTFTYANLRISPARASLGESVTVTAEVTNTGKRRGDEVVQLYVEDKVSSVTTYDQNLRGFERVTLDPGQTSTVSFRIEPEFLALWNGAMQRVVEPGEFEFQCGASSGDIRLRGTLVVQ